MNKVKDFLNRSVPFKTKLILLISLVLVLVTSDLIVKEVVNRKLKQSRQVEVIKGFWYLGYAENDDIGLSALRSVTQNMPTQFKLVLMLFLQGAGTILVIVIIFRTKHIKYVLPLMLILCAGLGNFIDRLLRGFVIDYIIWYFKVLPFRFFNPFPIFNLADCFGFTGAVLLFIVLIFYSDEKIVKVNKK